MCEHVPGSSGLVRFVEQLGKDGVSLATSTAQQVCIVRGVCVIMFVLFDRLLHRVHNLVRKRKVISKEVCVLSVCVFVVCVCDVFLEIHSCIRYCVLCVFKLTHSLTLIFVAIRMSLQEAQNQPAPSSYPTLTTAQPQRKVSFCLA